MQQRRGFAWRAPRASCGPTRFLREQGGFDVTRVPRVNAGSLGRERLGDCGLPRGRGFAAGVRVLGEPAAKISVHRAEEAIGHDFRALPFEMDFVTGGEALLDEGLDRRISAHGLAVVPE